MLIKHSFLITIVMCAVAAVLMVAQYVPALAAEAHRGTSRATKTDMATPNTKLDEIQSSKFKNLDIATPKNFKHNTASSGDTTVSTQGKGVKGAKFDVNATIFGNKGSSGGPQSTKTDQGAASKDTSVTNFNATQAIFGNQPYTHRVGATGTGAGSDPGTGTGSGSGTGNPGVRAANSEKPANPPTVGDPPPAAARVKAAESDADRPVGPVVSGPDGPITPPPAPGSGSSLYLRQCQIPDWGRLEAWCHQEFYPADPYNETAKLVPGKVPESYDYWGTIVGAYYGDYGADYTCVYTDYPK